jgi:hypothetical protein
MANTASQIRLDIPQTEALIKKIQSLSNGPISEAIAILRALPADIDAASDGSFSEQAKTMTTNYATQFDKLVKADLTAMVTYYTNTIKQFQETDQVGVQGVNNLRNTTHLAD